MTEEINAVPEKKPAGLFAMFGQNKDMEKDGIWVNYGDIGLLLARAGGSNQKFKTVFKHETKPYRRQMDNESLPEHQLEQLLARIYAKSVVLDWRTAVRGDDGELVLGADKKPTYVKTVNDDDGSALEFSVENVERLLVKLPELFADVRVMSGKFSNYQDEQDEADKGN